MLYKRYYLSWLQSALAECLLSCVAGQSAVSMARTADKRKAKHGAASTGGRPKRQRVDKDLLEDGGRDEFFVAEEPKEDASGSEPDAADEEAETAEEKRLRLGAAPASVFCLIVWSAATKPVSVLFLRVCGYAKLCLAALCLFPGMLSILTHLRGSLTLKHVMCAAQPRPTCSSCGTTTAWTVRNALALLVSGLPSLR